MFQVRFVKSETMKEKESEIEGQSTKHQVIIDQTTHGWMVFAQCFFTDRQRVM